jgi:hypothetical protein
MAFVTHVKQVPGKVRRHPTHVVAEVKIDDDSERDIIVQIDTRGSKSREIEGKLSQTIQLNRDTAQQLHSLLTKVYGFTK